MFKVLCMYKDGSEGLRYNMKWNDITIGYEV